MCHAQDACNIFKSIEKIHIGEVSTMLRKSCTYIEHWGENLAQILRIYCALTKESPNLANLEHILRMKSPCAIIAHRAQNTIN